MGKKIHILLSRKSWEELEEIKVITGIGEPKSYEEYLEDEKLNPTMGYIA